MSIGDSYIAISFGAISSQDSKDAWTGTIESPTYLSVLESEISAGTELFARMNAFVDGIADIDSTEFFVPRAAVASEDSGTVLGVALINRR